MKTTFKFFFYLIFYTALIMTVLYGTAQSFVEAHSTVFSFGVLAIVVIGIGGMMRSLDATSNRSIAMNRK